MIWKKIGLFAVLFIWLLMLGGCSNRNKVVNYPEVSEDITVITFFGNKYEPENVRVIEEIISKFMKKYPDIRVSYESLKGAEYYDALRKRMVSGKGNDIFMVNHDIVLELTSRNQLADLSCLTTISEYTNQMLDQMNKDGAIYWLPTTVSAFGLYCNIELLQKYKQRVPENLEEWERVCDYFLTQGITPIISNNDISLKTLAIGQSFYSLYQENNQEEAFTYLNQGEARLSSLLTSGFSLAEDFINKDYIDAEKALVTEKTSDDLLEFIKGEVPFMLTGVWAVGRIKEMQPDFEFQVVPYPALPDENFIVINADTRLSVNADSKHLDAAMKFVEFFTQTENIQRFAEQQSSFSPLNGGTPPAIKEIQPLISCYEAGRIVIGTDRRLNLPIWEWTATASKKLLSKEALWTVMDWLDRQAKEKGEDTDG